VRIERVLLVVVLMLLTYAPARALEVPSITPSPTQQKNANPLIPKSTPDDEGKGSLDSMKLLAPGIGWAQRSSDELHKTIYWTTDNGAHWRNITPPLTDKSNLAALFFLDTHRGWAVLEQRAILEQFEEEGKWPTNLRLVVATTNSAGATWSKTPLTLFLANYFSKEELMELNDIEVSKIAFADPLHGWLLFSMPHFPHGNAGLLLVTSDGGRTWKKADNYPAPNSADMMLLTRTEGWIFGAINPTEPPNSLFVTRDGAKSWQELSMHDTNVQQWPAMSQTIEGAYCDVYGLPMFSDRAHGFLQTDCSAELPDNNSTHTTVLLATNDGGRTWKQNRELRNFLGSCNTSTVVDSIWLAPVKRNDHIALLHVEVGANVDAGEDNGSESRYSLCWSTKLSFISPAQGWMLTDAMDKPTLQSTTDGGRTWKTISPPDKTPRKWRDTKGLPLARLVSVAEDRGPGGADRDFPNEGWWREWLSSSG
jgi:photosystem II stability/assembly factor-like uncharacterized protein